MARRAAGTREARARVWRSRRTGGPRRRRWRRATSNLVPWRSCAGATTPSLDALPGAWASSTAASATSTLWWSVSARLPCPRPSSTGGSWDDAAADADARARATLRTSPLPAILALRRAGHCPRPPRRTGMRGRRSTTRFALRGDAGSSSASSPRSRRRVPRRPSSTAGRERGRRRDPGRTSRSPMSCGAPWVLGELAFWRRRAGIREDDSRPVLPSRTRSGWPATGEARRSSGTQLGCPYEAALSLAGVEERRRAPRPALAELQRLGARPMAAVVGRGSCVSAACATYPADHAPPRASNPAQPHGAGAGGPRRSSPKA